MKTAIALRHIYFEDVGTLDAVLTEQGYQLQYIEPTIGKIDGEVIRHADLLIVLGGSIGAYDEKKYPFLEDELAIVRQRLDSGKPLLGICLGAQLIARALGAKVYPMRSKEIGFAPLAMTSAGKTSVLAALGGTAVLHWHGDQFDIPANGVHLAGTSVCPNQAFSIGRNVLGLQFHMEVDVKKIEQWLVGHACELYLTSTDISELRMEAAKSGNGLSIAARLIFKSWLNQLETHNKVENNNRLFVGV